MKLARAVLYLVVLLIVITALALIFFFLFHCLEENSKTIEQAITQSETTVERIKLTSNPDKKVLRKEIKIGRGEGGERREMPVGVAHFIERGSPELRVHLYNLKLDWDPKIKDDIIRSDLIVSAPNRRGTKPVKISLPPKKISNPRQKKFRTGIWLDIMAGVSTKPCVTIGVSPLAFGSSRKDVDWRFLRLGIGIKDEDPVGTFSPLLWRPDISFITGVYLGPYVDINLEDFSYGGGIGIHWSF